MEKELEVLCIHGEGDRATVNKLQTHRNKIAHIDTVPDEQPDVVVVLRDEEHRLRIELPLVSWDEVEDWKKLAGWDAKKRHWHAGARVKVTFG
jgi:hypothetical protein